MSQTAQFHRSKSSPSHRMDPSVPPFHAHQSSTRSNQLRPVFAQRSPRYMMPAQQASPSYPSERLEMYRQAPLSNQRSFPPPPHTNGPIAPNHNPEALIADMWKSCPALCTSIRHDFNLRAIFHPALFTTHGETFLRLAASQIAMQNQAAEMTDMRTALSQKETLLEVNNASAKDLQSKLMTQQSELKEIRALLEQPPQSLTSSDAIEDGQLGKLHYPESDIVSRGGVVSSPSTPQSVPKSIDDPVTKFYGRSAALPPLRVCLPSDNVDKHDEIYGYGHAETYGATFEYDRPKDSTSENNTVLSTNQPNPLAPNIWTSAIFDLGPSLDTPVVSIAAKEQISRTRDKGSAEIATFADRRSAIRDTTVPARIKIMKREDGTDFISRKSNNQLQTWNSEAPNDVGKPIAVTPSKSESDNEPQRNALLSRPASYAAAVRTDPSTPSEGDPLASRRAATISQSSTALDLGFTLEPLPKPTIQQVQSQSLFQQPQQQPPPKSVQPEQQKPQTLNTNSSGPDDPFDFEEWRQRKIANGTWVDRSNPPNSRQKHQRPFCSNYRGRGGRFQYSHHENFRPGPMTEDEQKRAWLAWKQNLVRQGRWNPDHPFKEAWKNN